MTILNKPVTRLSTASLDGSHGADRGRRLVVTLMPAANDNDMLEIKPHGRRSGAIKRVKLVDLYSYALRCEANKDKMKKLSEKKEAKRLRDEERRSRRIIRGGLPTRS